MSTSHLIQNPPLDESFTLGRVVVDPTRRTVSLDGRSQNCEPKVFDLLLYFCARHDQIITREMLLEDIWQGRVVSDNAINRKVYQLRKLFSDLDHATEYIETIPKFGYRLTQPVVKIQKPPADTRQPLFSDKKPLWLSLILVILVGLALLINRSLFNQTLAQPPKLRQVTAMPGIERNAKLSPDGRQLLFSFSQNAQSSHLILKQLGMDKQRQLTFGEHHDVNAVWHPSGETIAFVRLSDDPQQRCGIFQLRPGNIDAKPERLVACSHAGIPVLSYGRQPKQLFFTDRSAKNKPFILYSLDTERRVKKQLTQPALQNNLSGDYFVTRNATGDKQAILRYLGSSKVMVSIYQSLPFEQLEQFQLDAHINDIAWHNDEQWFYYRKEQHIQRINSQSKNSEPVFHLGRPFEGLSFAGDGRQLLLNTFESDSDIWQAGANQNNVSFIGSTKKDFRPRFAHNSTQMAFLSDRSGTTQFWLKNEKGEVAQISNFDFDLAYTWFNWSFDNRYLLFEHQDEIYTLQIKSGELKKRLDSSEKAYFASWSAQGKQLYYGSTKSGDWQIWQLNLADNSSRQLTFNGGYSAHINPKDGLLYFSKYHQNGLWRLNADSSESLVIEDFSLLNWLNWSIQDNHIIYAKPNQSVYSFDLRSHEQNRLMDFEPSAIHDYSVSSVSSEVLYSKRMSQSGDILMLEFR